MQEKNAVIILFLGLIAITAFSLSNSYYYYTTHDSYMDIPSPQNFAIGSDVINDTKKPSNITTVVQSVKEEKNELVVEFNHTTSQQDLEIDYFQCKIDNINWGECSSPYVLKLSDFDRNSNHTLEIRAIDMNGNAEANPVAILFPIETVK